MKHLLSTILCALAASFCVAQEEIVVSPSQMNGWECGTFGPNGHPSTSWYLGYKAPPPQLGNGDLWLYTGNADGIAYGETKQYRGTPLANITKLSYCTYTARSLGNVAPTMNVKITTGGSDCWLEYSPGLNGNVPRNQWIQWTPLQGKWWSSRNGGNDRRLLSDWAALYPDAVIDTIRLQAGTWGAGGNDWRDSWLGVDLPTIAFGVSQGTRFNFEPDVVSGQNGNVVPKAVPIPGAKTPEVAKGDNIVIITPPKIINPWIIEYPVYYIYEGAPVGKKPDATVEDKPTSYQVGKSLFVPLLFDGNTTIKEALSKIPGIGNPDAKATTVPKITEGGAFSFNGVPFYIPKDKKNAWDADIFQDNESHKIVIKAGLENVTEVHTIMNLTYAYSDKLTVLVEFEGSKGAKYSKELVANKDIRDWHPCGFDTISLPSHPVWVRPITEHLGHDKCEIRLDSQVFKLPKEFATQELKTITITDRGAYHKQRVFLVGVTAKVN